MVKLDDEIHGLAHISELSDKTIHDSRELESMFEVGKEYDFEIVNIEPAEHRLGLRAAGLKKKKKEETNEEVKEEVKVETKTEEVVEIPVVEKKKAKEKTIEVVEEPKEEVVEEKVEVPTEETEA